MGAVSKLLTAGLSLALVSCSGSIGDPPKVDPGPAGTGNSGGTGGVGGPPTGPGGGPPTGTGGSPPIGAVVGPESGRRLTKQEYVNTVNDLLGVNLSAPADLDVLLDDQPSTGGGFRNDIHALLPASQRTDAYETIAVRVSERVAWAGKVATYASCVDATPACREGFVRKLGRVMYRRPLIDREIKNLTPLFNMAGTGANTFEVGGRLVLQAMLQSPFFLYRLERLDSVDSMTGMPAPGPLELATRLSYLLWASSPTPELLDAAERGDLSGDASFLDTVKRMASDARARVGFEGYAQDWLQLYRLDTRTPNVDLGVTPNLLTEMKQETLRFLNRVALTEGRDLASLFTDKVTELGPALASIYGLTPKGQTFASYDLSNDPNRVGILTQPGFLILRAAPERATIVHRGLMVMRIFLCSEVPAPPADAATMIDAIPPNLTDRERFGLHASNNTCKACHQAIDPLGYPFEPFDMSGRFRAKDEHGNVLRSDGTVTLDGTAQPYKNTAEFAALMSRSPTVQRCLVAKMMQYGMGRSLLGPDETAIEELTKRFQNDGRTYAAALTAVASSPALRAMAPNK